MRGKILSKLLIRRYLTDISRLKQISGTERESVVREAFKDLLKGWAKDHDLTFIPEYEIQTPSRERRYVDGGLLHTLRVPFGYWEAKDSDDDLEAEIAKKFRIGYPRTNIIFEDSKAAILYQNGREVARCPTTDVDELEKLLQKFFAYERPEISEFRKAVEQFSVDLPAVLGSLRDLIQQVAEEPAYKNASDTFLEHIRKAINPHLVLADVREMLIQHILTSEVFLAVFPGTTYHEENNIAKRLRRLELTFFKGNKRFQTLRGLEPYYASIRRTSSQITSNREKQNFLKAVYENFYKVYNPKAAARLGIVYTPYQIVRFMTAATEYLCEKHFKRSLLHPDVDILDPSTGTGTFICDLIETFAGQPRELAAKYVTGMHANEVGLLPYYVANVNIEATFAALTGEYIEFPGLCLVDTLDNTFALRKQRGHMDSLFGSVSDENVERIRAQNQRTISVIIGNPPYRANQLNENHHNKNRVYPEIDKRIKETYVLESKATKTKTYDMYTRFFRWATDRLDADGILALVTNRSFVDKSTFDGFRSTVAKEFNHIYVVDLGGSVVDDPRLSGTKHNVFGIKTGVAIVFMVRRKKAKGCEILYANRPELETAQEKLAFLGNTDLSDIKLQTVRPDEKFRWINHSSTDEAFSSLIPIASKQTKNASKEGQLRAIFKMFSLGVITARDEWVYDNDSRGLAKKIKGFINTYNERKDYVLAHAADDMSTEGLFGQDIKWSRALMARARAGGECKFNERHIIPTTFRPFMKQYLYFDPHLNEVQYQLNRMYKGEANPSIAFMSVASSNPLSALAVDGVFDYCLLKKGNGGTQAVSRWIYGKDGHKESNITSWGLKTFQKRYAKDRNANVTEDRIFHYVYAVLHDPVYKKRFALDLKRAYPRIPLHDDFSRWVSWGKELMELHSTYESARPSHSQSRRPIKR
jgi:predicted helicase